MAFTTYTLDGDVSDIIGADYDPTTVTIELKASDPVVSDGATKTRFGKVSISPEADGTFEIPEIPSSAGDGPLYALTLKWGNPHSRVAQAHANVAWFEMLSDDNLAAVVRRTLTPTLITPDVALDLTTARDEAVAAEVAAAGHAQAAADLVLSDLGTTDGQTRALVENPASQTAGAIADTLAADPRRGSLAPAPLQGAALANTNVLVCDVVDGVVWGSYNGFFHSSTDGGATWTQRMALPVSDTLRGLRATADGEVVALFPQVIYKSSGWNGIGSTPTWTLKVTVTGLARHSRFSFDGDGQKFIAGQYGPGAGQAWIDSRYAYISTDAGTTWTAAWDSDAETSNAPADSHVHGCCYDPWADRFYVSEGHSTSAGLWCSEDDGATWFLAPGLGTNPTNSVTGMLAGPTTITATDDGLCCGSDDVIGGLYGIPRLADATKQQLQQTYFWRPNRTGTNGFGEKGYRDPNTGLVYVAFESSGPAPIIAAGTATSGGLVWEWPAWTGDANDFLESVVVLDGNLIAYGQELGTKKQLTGKIGKPGTGLTTDTGGVRGGKSLDPTSLAAGRAATTGTQIRAVALGVGSSGYGDGVAVGYGSSTSATLAVSVGYLAAAASSAVAIGANVTATTQSVLVGTGAVASVGNACVAVGQTASAGTNAVAVGRAAVASSNSVAIGNASASAGARGVALGQSASAANADSVALGQSTTTNKTFQVHMGPRHLAGANVAAEPAAAAAGSGLLYFIDNAGKVELRVKFPTGSPVTLAAQP
jgi:hypothetical protein